MMKKKIILLMLMLVGCNASNTSALKSPPKTDSGKTTATRTFHKDLRTYLKHQAQNQDAEGLTLLGETYVFGVSKERDYAKAYECFSKAADLGHMRAQNHKAWLLFMGRGVDQNKPEAQKWWRKSCEAGYEPACQRLSARKQGKGEGEHKQSSRSREYFYVAKTPGVFLNRWLSIPRSL